MEEPKPRHRSTLYILFCLASATYNGLMALIFGSAFALSVSGSSVLQKYSQQYDIPGIQFGFVTGVSFFGFLAGITGSILLWNLRIAGLYTYTFSFLIITGIQLYVAEFNYTYILLNLIFLVYFLTQFRRIRPVKL